MRQEIHSYDELIATLRTRAADLGITLEAVDVLGGLAGGHCSKIFGKSQTKKLGPGGLALYLDGVSQGTYARGKLLVRNSSLAPAATAAGYTFLAGYTNSACRRASPAGPRTSRHRRRLLVSAPIECAEGQLVHLVCRRRR